MATTIREWSWSQGLSTLLGRRKPRPDPTKDGRRLGPWTRLLLAGASGALLACAFDPIGLWPVAFIALVPLLISLSCGGWFGAMLNGMFVGLVWYAISLSWISELTVAGFTGMMVWLMLQLGVVCVVARLMLQRGRWWSFLGVPCLWVAWEFARTFEIPVAFPWLLLGYSQYKFVPLIQLADLGGVLLISFVIVFVNVSCVAPVVRYMRHPATGCGFKKSLLYSAPVIAVAVVGLSCIYGMIRIPAVEARYTAKQGPRIALIQPNMRADQPLSPTTARSRHIELTRRALSMTERDADGNDVPLSIDLLVFGETMLWHGVMEGFEAGPLDDARRAVVEAGGIEMLEQGRLPALIVGAQVSTQQPNTDITLSKPGAANHPVHPPFRRNTAYFLRPYQPDSVVPQSYDDMVIDHYDKQELVPAGEEIPYARELPAMVEAVAAGYGSSQLPNTRRGTRNTQFIYPEPSGPNVDPRTSTRFAVPICYEMLFADTMRELARGEGEPNAAPVDYFINISNDNWYRRSAELEQMLAMAVFRSVENRAGMARCTNTGISAFIAPTGEIEAILEGERFEKTRAVDSNGEPIVIRETGIKEVQGVLVRRVTIARGAGSPYRDTVRDGFAIGCVVVTALVFILALWRPAEARHRLKLETARAAAGAGPRSGVRAAVAAGKPGHLPGAARPSSPKLNTQNAQSPVTSSTIAAPTLNTTVTEGTAEPSMTSTQASLARAVKSRLQGNPDDRTTTSLDLNLDHHSGSGNTNDPMRASQGIVHKPPPSSGGF